MFEHFLGVQPGHLPETNLETTLAHPTINQLSTNGKEQPNLHSGKPLLSNSFQINFGNDKPHPVRFFPVHVRKTQVNVDLLRFGESDCGNGVCQWVDGEETCITCPQVTPPTVYYASYRQSETFYPQRIT